ncbi:hypothetical protein Tco_1335149 [Tanacetum coccineum]
MTGHRSQLINFVSKFMGTVKFGNDHVAAIRGYKDYQIGNITISQVYYMEGLGHNLFSVGQFCDSDLEVAFRKHTCFVHDLEGRGSCDSLLYPKPFSNSRRHNKTPYELIHDRKPDLTYFHVFGALCYSTNDGEDPEPSSQQSSLNVQPTNLPFEHIRKWTKIHPLKNVIDNPSRPVSTQKQLQTDAMWCFFDPFLTSVEPKNFKEALLESSWIDVMQEEIYKFERLDV